MKSGPLDESGVIVDTNSINSPPNRLTKAQNAIPDPTGSKGSLVKRPGLKQFSQSTTGSPVLGGIGVPAALGSAGPDFQNPFNDNTNGTNLTFTSIVNEFGVGNTNKLGNTTDDTGQPIDWDWLNDFPDLGLELDELLPDQYTIEPWKQQPPDKVQIPPHFPLNLTFNNNASATVEYRIYLSCRDTVNFIPANDVDINFYDSSGSFGSPFPPVISGYLLNFTLPNFSCRITGTGASSPFNSWYAGSPVGGGYPLPGQPLCRFNNAVYYASNFYSLSSNPIIGRYDGLSNNIIARVPNVDGVTPKAIVAMLAANESIYFTTYDSGSNGAGGGTIKGSAWVLNTETNDITRIGTAFPTGHMPYCLTWAYGKLWVGTAVNSNADTTAGRVYFIRPDVETAFTLDNTFSANEHIVSDLAVFKGQIYASIIANDGTGGTVYVRSTTGTWSSSDTALDDPARLIVWPTENYGLDSLQTPGIYVTGRIGTTIKVRRNTGAGWSEVYTRAVMNRPTQFRSSYVVYYPTGTTLSFLPRLELFNQSNFAIGVNAGGSWSDRTLAWTPQSTQGGTFIVVQGFALPLVDKGPTDEELDRKFRALRDFLAAGGNLADFDAYWESIK